MEALASFGGIGLASIPVRRIDLRSELKLEVEREKNKKRKLDEMEGAEPPIKVPRTRFVCALYFNELCLACIPVVKGVQSSSLGSP